MQSGKLDRRIAIQSNTPVANDIGEWIPVWTTVLFLWASIEYRFIEETFEAAERTAPNEVIFRTRYNSGINEKMRIIYAGNQYDILHIETINRSEGLKITAVKKDNVTSVSAEAGALTFDSISYTFDNVQITFDTV